MRARDVIQPSGVWALLGCWLLGGWALGGPRPLHSLSLLPGPVSTWMPPQGVGAALAFLYSGDAQQLLRANCSQRYEVPGVEARPGHPPGLQRAAGALAQAANLLNVLLQANDIREASVEEDAEWYQALVRSVAEGDPRAHQVRLTFNSPPGASSPPLALQATRVGAETLLQQLAGSRVGEASAAEGPDGAALHRRVLTNDLRSLGSPKWPRGDAYVGDVRQVRLSPPFLDCQKGRLRPGWLVTLSATFYGLTPDLSPEVRGQVQMDVDLQSVDINQCANGPGWFSDTHLCDLNSTQCVPLEGRGFVLGHYLCRCRPGFFGASGSGGLEQVAWQPPGQFGSLQGNAGRLLQCQPCPEGCTSCRDATPCLVREAPALRAVVLACQACCMLAVFLSMLVSYRCLRNKRIRVSGVVLLEAVLFGALLLYFSVFILCFKPSVFRCIALRWVRLLGFATVYGTVTLKLYRMLRPFLSRAAQRGAPLGSGQLLRRLGLLLLAVLGFLAVWTAGVLERGQLAPLVIRGHTAAGRHFYVCHQDRSDYVMAVVEVLLLCWGNFLSSTTRVVPSAFLEPRYLGLALRNELLLSTAFHSARFMLAPSLHPDWTLLLFFFHTHSTVTTTLALIFVPKLRKPGLPPHEEIWEEVDEDELDLQRSGSYLDSSIASAWSERSLDPGDIRDELKKLYAQLEVRKTAEMAVNNPHLLRKRGSSRQGPGRSFMRYLVEALARQHSRDPGYPGHSNLPGSSCHRLLSSSHQVAPDGALHQSRRAYNQHHREQELPTLDSMLRRTLSKKASRLEGREPTPGPPALGFRSASAHNLTVGERLPQAWPGSLHKSLSVMAGSREKALLVASQAYLEETYWQVKERQERQRAEVATASPLHRPSARRLGQAWGAPLSAPPSPAKSSSVDISPASGRPQDGGRRLPHPPVRHQVSSPILALSGACLAEPHRLSPSSTLAPTPTSAPAPVPAPPQSPSLLTYICPWENAELPVKKETAAQEGILSRHSPSPARAKLWRALSMAVEKRVAGDSEVDTKDRRPEGEADDGAEDKPKTFSKSHSLKTPVQQGSVRSLGLAIKVLTRSRSTYREKEGGEGGPETEKGRASGAAVAGGPRSPRLGRPKAVVKQMALEPCEDEESLQNQQNAHTSRMLQGCHQEQGREQEARGRKLSQGPGERRVERAGKSGLGGRSTRQAKEAPVRQQEPPESGLLLGGADHGVASDTGGWDSNKAEICPWEVSEAALWRTASGQLLGDSQEEKGTATGKPEPGGVAVTAQRKPEQVVCSWEGAYPGATGRFEAARVVDHRKAEKPQAEVLGTEAPSPYPARAELCPWEVDEGRQGTSAPGERVLPQEGWRAPKRAASWREQERGGGLESLCPRESADFRGPSVVPLQVSGSLGRSIAEVCPPVPRKAEGCPWESVDPSSSPAPPGPHDPERPPERLGTARSRAAEVCPWDVEDALTDEKARICPWEVGARAGQERAQGAEAMRSPNATGKTCAGSGPGETQSPGRPPVWREAACPRETSGPRDSRQREDTVDTDGPRAGHQDQGLLGCRPVDVCPWEVQEAPSSNKAKICPWEENEGATGKGLTQETESRETPEKGQFHSPGGGVAKQEAKLHQEQEAVCPPGDQDSRAWSAPVPKASDLEVRVEGTEKGEQTRPKDRLLPEQEIQGKAPASKAESVTEDGARTSKARLSICPGASMAPEGSLFHPDSRRPDRLEANSQTLGSGRGSVGLDVCEAPSSAKAEIWPREAMEKVPEKGASSQGRKGDSQDGTGRAQGRLVPQQVQETPEMTDCRKLEAMRSGDSGDGGGVAPQLAPRASEGRRGKAGAAGQVGVGAAEVSVGSGRGQPLGAGGGAGEGTPAQGVAGGSQGHGEEFLLKAGSAGAEGDFATAVVAQGGEQDGPASEMVQAQRARSPREMLWTPVATKPAAEEQAAGAPAQQSSVSGKSQTRKEIK